MVPHIGEGLVGELEADSTQWNTHVIPTDKLVEIFWFSYFSLNGNVLN